MKSVRLLKDFWEHKEGDVIEVSNERSRWMISQGYAVTVGKISEDALYRRRRLEQLARKIVKESDSEFVEKLSRDIEDQIISLQKLLIDIREREPDDTVWFNKRREYLCCIGDVRHTFVADEILVFKTFKGKFCMAFCSKDRVYVDVTSQVERSTIRSIDKKLALKEVSHV